MNKPRLSLSAQVQSIQKDVIDRWHEKESLIQDWNQALAELPPQQSTGWQASCERLQLINTFQWHEEDKSRAHGAGDAFLGAVKRSIDASNRRRVQTVDRLDDLIFSQVKQNNQLNPEAPLNSESPGSIIDRLSVLALKRYHVAEAALAEKLESLNEQIADLGQCLDDLMLGLAQGTVRIKFYRQIKLYQDADTGRIKPDL